MQPIEEKLYKIASAVFQHIAETDIENIGNIGVFAGKSGILLFLSHYLKRYPCRELEKQYGRYLDGFLEVLTDTPPSNAYILFGTRGGTRSSQDDE